ncbi:hypothetical protein ACFL0M_14495 [Thermodesulfobacteriota bacterium]
MKPIAYYLKIIIFLFICCSTTCLYATDEVYSLKGIVLGSDIAEIANDERFECQITNSPLGDKTCHLMEKYISQETIADVPVSTVTLHYFNDKLKSIVITFDQKHFYPVQEALEQTYGAPSTYRIETYVNRWYELYEGHVYIWENNALMIDAIECFPGPGESAVVYKLDFNR